MARVSIADYKASQGKPKSRVSIADYKKAKGIKPQQKKIANTGNVLLNAIPAFFTNTPGGRIGGQAIAGFTTGVAAGVPRAAINALPEDQKAQFETRNPAELVARAGGEIAGSVVGLPGVVAKGVTGLAAKGLSGIAMKEAAKRGLAGAAGAAAAGFAETPFDANLRNPESLINPLARTGQAAVSVVGGKVIEKVGTAATRAVGRSAPKAGELVANISKVFGEKGRAVAERARQAGIDIQQALAPVARQEFDDVVEQGVYKGIRPSKTKTGDITLRKRYMGKMNEAVDTILENKNDVMYMDGTTGRVPESASEALDAIQQTKEKLWTQITAEAQNAGQQGARVPVRNIRSELIKFSRNPQLARLGKDGDRLAEYAIDLAERYKDDMSPGDAIETLKLFNDKLSGFYKTKVGFDHPIKAATEARVAYLLRQNLDDAVSSVTGRRIQPLRNRYGALKEMEKELSGRATVYKRQSPSGFFDLTEAFSSGDIIGGAVRMFGDPVGGAAQMAKGGMMKAVTSEIKRRNSPDYIIGQMFKKADDIRPYMPQKAIIADEIVQPRSGKALPPPDQARRIPTADEVKRDTQNYFRNQAAEKSDIPVRPTPEQAYSMRNRELPAPEQAKALPFQREAKAPYEFTRADVVKSLGRKSDNIELKRRAILQHKEAIKQAIKDGKPVSKDVLAGYPDLEKKYGPEIERRLAANDQASAILKDRPGVETTPDFEVPQFMKTRDEIKKGLGAKATNEQKRRAVLEHKKQVREAIKNGENVPEEVVKGYEDLYKEWKKARKK